MNIQALQELCSSGLPELITREDYSIRFYKRMVDYESDGWKLLARKIMNNRVEFDYCQGDNESLEQLIQRAES